ncbi:MAG: GerMN domain-containing protein [Pelosinus sp.]|nr:GerMN domain-containing protein [Pelosinus sp.]
MRAKKVFCWLLVFTGMVLLAGCAGNAAMPEKEAAPPNGAVNQPAGVKADKNAPTAMPSGQQAKTMPLTTYQADKDALHLISENHIVPFDEHPAQTAVSLLIAGPKSPGLISVVPAGTEVLGITINDHIAYVNFNDKLQKVSGSTGELLLVGAIVNTLTEFPEIQKVQILVNDKKVATLSGHLDVSEPFARMDKIIKK